MKETLLTMKLGFSLIGGIIGFMFGEIDGLILALIVFVIIDYVTGFICAWVEKKLSSEVGAKGIAKKVFIFMLVAIANVIDTQVLQSGATLRTAVIFFYLANEGVSICENAGRLGLPIPQKLKAVLEQLNEEEKEAEKIDKDEEVPEPDIRSDSVSDEYDQQGPEDGD